MECLLRRQWHPTPVLLPGKSHGRRSLVGCSPWGLEELDMAERLHFHFSLLCIGEGNGNPLQCSCLENPEDGVTQSRTWLKWLISSMECLRTLVLSNTRHLGTTSRKGVVSYFPIMDSWIGFSIVIVPCKNKINSLLHAFNQLTYTHTWSCMHTHTQHTHIHILSFFLVIHNE